MMAVENLADLSISTITNLQGQFQILSSSVDKDALLCVENNQHWVDSTKTSSSNLTNLFTVQSKWQRLQEEQECLRIHTRNAANYHQFYQGVAVCENGLQSKAITVKQLLKNETNTSAISNGIKLLLEEMLTYQSLVEHLNNISEGIIALRHRSEQLKEPVKAIILLRQENLKDQLSDNEECLLLDNTNPAKWKVKRKSGQIVEMPAICILTPAIDQSASLVANRLAKQLFVTWKDCVRVLEDVNCSYFKRFFSKNANIQKPDPALVSEAMSLLKDLLLSSNPLSPECASLATLTDDWIKIANSTPLSTGHRRDTNNNNKTAESVWKNHITMLHRLQEFITFAKAYDPKVKIAQNQLEQSAVDKNEDHKFESKAYITIYPSEEAPVGKFTSTSAIVPQLSTLVEKAPVFPLAIDAVDGENAVTNGVKEEDLVEEEWVTEEYEEPEEFSSQTIKKTQTFVIVGVKDPRSEEQVSLYRAIADGIVSQSRGIYIDPITGHTMPIPEAMAKGLIMVEYTNEHVEEGDLIKNGILRIHAANDIFNYSVLSVVDPNTGQKISLKDAVDKGVIDQVHGMYVNPKTGIKIPISAAAEKGFLEVDKMDVKRRETKENEVKSNSGILVESVYDLKSKKMLQGDEALKSGLIDVNNGFYVNPLTNERIALSDAIKRGFVKGKFGVDQGDHDVIVSSIAVDLKRHPSLENLLKKENSSVQNNKSKSPSESILDKLALESAIDPLIKGVFDKGAKKEITLKEAVENGMLLLDELSVMDEKGLRKDLARATADGYLSPLTTQNLIKSLELHSLTHALESPKVNVKNKASIGQSLCEAIKRGDIDPELIFYKDQPTRMLMSVDAAIRNGKWNSETGKVSDPYQNKEVSLLDAISGGVIDPDVNHKKVASEVSGLQMICKSKLANVKGIKDTLTDQEMTIEEAIQNGTLNLSRAEYVDRKTGKHLAIGEAVVSDLIDTDVGKQLLIAISNNSLGHAIDNGIVDITTGKVFEPSKNIKIPLKEAFALGLLDAASTYFVDTLGHKIVSFQSAIEAGQFDLDSSRFLDGKTHLDVGLLTAVNNDIIRPHIDVNEFITCPLSVKDFLAQNKNSVITLPSGRLLDVRQAVANGFLSADSLLNVDAVSGQGSLLEHADIIDTLLSQYQLLDWLTGQEKQLVTAGVCDDNISKLNTSLLENKEIEKSFQDNEYKVNKAVEEGKKLLVQDFKSRDNQMLQLHQKLRTNTSEIKVRYDTDLKEVRNRVHQLPELINKLNQTYNTVDESLLWLNNARDDLNKIKQAFNLSDWSETVTTVEKFYTQVLSKTENCENIIKNARNTSSMLKNYQKQLDNFQNKLPEEIKKTLEVGTNLDLKLTTLSKGCIEILEQCKKLRGQVREINNKFKSFQLMEQDLSNGILNLEQTVQATGPDGQSCKNQLVARMNELKDLNQCKEDLVQLVKSHGLSCPTASLSDSVDSLTDKFQKLENVLNTKTLKEQSDVSGGKFQLESLLEWVENMEKQLLSVEPVSLLEQRLVEQQRIHRLMMADIDSKQALINNVTARSDIQPNEQVAELLDRYDALVGKLLERDQNLNSVRTKIGELSNWVKELDVWLNDAVSILKKEDVSDSSQALRNTIQILFKQKQEKQELMEQVKSLTKELLENESAGDKNILRRNITDLQTKWHDLTETLVRLFSFAALRDIDDTLQYLDKAENEINTAEPISCDPETVAMQLKDHTTFHDEVMSRRLQVNETMDKCSRMLREVTSDDIDEVKYKLEAIRSQADLVSKLSSDRLTMLEEALPLATHFSLTHGDLQGWLAEIEADIDTVDTMPGSAIDQIKKQQDLVKVTQNVVAEHRPLVNDLVITGGELCDVCTDDDTSAVRDDVSSVLTKYEQLKMAVTDKAHTISQLLHAAATDPHEMIDALMDEIHHLANLADLSEPIAANITSLREQLAENTALLSDIEKTNDQISDAKSALRRQSNEKTTENDSVKDDFTANVANSDEELKSKLTEIDALQANLKDRMTTRGQQLSDAISVAEKFDNDLREVLRILTDAQDNLLSQDTPGIEPATVEEQLRELQVIKDDLQEAHQPWTECLKAADELKAKCGFGGQMEIQKQMEEVEALMSELLDGVKERGEELDLALARAERFEQMVGTILGWLPQLEQRMQALGPLASDSRALRVQLEDMKVLRIQLRACQSDMNCLNQYFSQLKSSAPVSAESGQQQVVDINDRWTAIYNGCSERERALNEATVKLGEVEMTQDDLLGFLQQTEVDVQNIDIGYSDPGMLETHIKQLQAMERDVKNLESVVRKLGVAVDELGGKGHSGRISPILTKQMELKQQYDMVVVATRNKLNDLQDMLKQVKNFMGNVDDLLRWLSDYRVDLKSSAAMGALPDTAQKNCDTFLAGYNELAIKEEEVKAILLSGEEMIARCHQSDARQLTESLNKLRTRMYDTRNKAERKKRQVMEHLQNVSEFHATLAIHTDWLNNAEKNLLSLKTPSKLLNTVTQQMEDFKQFKQDVEEHRELMHHLDRTGTYLKYFGRKQDTIYIKNLLMSIKLRWLKLVRRMEEKERMLQLAFREDKRFHDAWHTLNDWLDTNERKLKLYVSAGVAVTSKVKQDIDELKIFSSLLNSQYPIYHSTLRQGHALKDRCVRNDPEREVLINMIEELKNKWNVVRSMTSQSQNKLDEALISSGRFADAVQSLLEWLNKSEAYLAEEQPILGDLDTVTSLIEQHKEFEQELESRQAMVKVIRMSPNTDASVVNQLDMLTGLMDKVTQLSKTRELRLQDALHLAEEFNEAVHVVREYLPQMEAELKFKALPEDEHVIIQLIEQHERFLDDLRSQQANIDKIRFLAEEIMISCHPNAVRFVKYYLTITHTRWEQAMSRCAQRSQRLQDALYAVRGNSALLDELLTWLSEAHALLLTKEKDIMSDDLTVVEALLKEHLEFHEELTNKNRDVERLTKSGGQLDDRKQLFDSGWKLNESSAPSVRASALHTKWRNVWRMSVDRKKKLQDAFENLLELESFKNFDFTLWRQRYMAWIRSKKLRITDFFRKQDKDGDGVLSRSEFINGMMMSKFPTNKTELNAVFDIFDKSNTGMLDYSEFIEALRPDRTNKGKSRIPMRRTKVRPQKESELVHDEVEQQVARCQCRHQLKVVKIGDGKYKFGDKEKICMVRFLNNTVMVRVGGGWVTLSAFLDSNDPCRAKGRLNLDLREHLRDQQSSSSRSPAASVRHGAGSPSSLANTPTTPTSTIRRKSLAATSTQSHQLSAVSANHKSPTVQRRVLPANGSTPVKAATAQSASKSQPLTPGKNAIQNNKASSSVKLTVASSVSQNRSRSRSPATRNNAPDNMRKLSMTPKSSKI